MAALAAGGIVLLALGVWMAVEGDVVLAVGTLAFGVACLAAVPVMRPARRAEEPLVVGEVPLGEQPLRGLVIRFSEQRARFAVAGLAAFTVLGVTLLLDGATLTGILVTATFAVLTLIGLVQVVRGTGRLVLGEESIAHVGRASAVVLAWDAVTDIEQTDVRGTPFLSLYGAAERYGVSQMFGGRFRSYGDLPIPLAATGVDDAWLERVIRGCVEDPALRREVAAGRGPAHPSG
jgi:hypothetical protein